MRLKILSTVVLLYGGLTLNAQEIIDSASSIEPDQPPLFMEMRPAEPVEFSIRFFDKQIYRPDSAINIKLTIRNNSGETYRFKLADDRAFNVEFDVRTVTNNALQPSVRLIATRTANSRIFYRELAIEPGEEYSFTENLQNYRDISSAGNYTVQAQFYPELLNGGEPSLESRERLALSVIPGERLLATINEGTPTAVATIIREPLSPDQVVNYVLSARQQEQWARFFLYFDLEGLYRTEPSRERRFLRLSEADRQQEIANFRQMLQSGTLNAEINTRPQSFRILETRYTPDEGQVMVEQKFDAGDFVEVKQFTYFLRRRDRFWEIYDYVVLNLGTESIVP